MAMAEARLESQWDHTASVLALLANCHAEKGKRFTPADFHPAALARQREAQKNAPKLPVSVLKGMFVKPVTK